MMKVLGNRVFVTRLDAPKAKSSVIEVVEFNPELSQFAVVLAAGPAVREVKVGQTVILGKYSGAPSTVKMNDNEVEGYFVTEEDILAVVK
jgi:co-chaperonin GroES (HSP10)